MSPAIAIDGKEMRRSFDKAAERSNINSVTAFAHGARLTLGIAESARGGGEISALRALIERLDIRGITITADALHCQRETCELIVREGGDYCLQLKGNQGDMLADVCAFVEDQDTDCIDTYDTRSMRIMVASKSGHIASAMCRSILPTSITGRICRLSSTSSPGAQQATKPAIPSGSVCSPGSTQLRLRQR